MKKKMIQPVNKHLLIKPVVHESFIASQKETYEEIGEVLAMDESIGGNHSSSGMEIEYVVNVGDKVYFDSWLAAKFPGEKEGEHYWLIKFEHIRAVEHAEG